MSITYEKFQFIYKVLLITFSLSQSLIFGCDCFESRNRLWALNHLVPHCSCANFRNIFIYIVNCLNICFVVCLRWSKCSTSWRIYGRSRASCLTKLRSCSKHARIWTIREIIRGMHYWVYAYFASIFVDTTFFLLVAVPVHANSNCALNVFSR